MQHFFVITFYSSFAWINSFNINIMDTSMNMFNYGMMIEVVNNGDTITTRAFSGLD